MEPLVSVSLITHNSAKYVKDALNGFVIQKINFPAEIVVCDVASTDGTQDILKEQAEKDADVFNVLYLKEDEAKEPWTLLDIETKYQLPRIRGKYIARCDPTDYWFHVGKLNVQVKYMEDNRNCACAFHSMVFRDEQNNGHIMGIDQVWPTSMSLTAEEFLAPSPFEFSDSSMMYRRDFAEELPAFRETADNYAEALKYQLAAKGYFQYFPDIMGVHRANIPGSFEEKMQTDADFVIKHSLNTFKELYEYNQYTSGHYAVMLGAKVQNNVEILSELNVLQNYPGLVEVIIQTEDKIKNLEDLKKAADSPKGKKAAKKYKLAQKEYWNWFINSVGESMKI